ncbi:E3 ubiquitin-protein ligase RNF180 [Rhinoderma darwinii]|uniref:E3 ubiquitin-protein ligase RNF180 n=1 Tax=Rhinoderma darwinii TaxID=43563 RepID=UPI003F675F63
MIDRHQGPNIHKFTGPYLVLDLGRQTTTGTAKKMLYWKTHSYSGNSDVLSHAVSFAVCVSPTPHLEEKTQKEKLANHIDPQTARTATDHCYRTTIHPANSSHSQRLCLSIQSMSYRSTAVLLRCWKCRKFVANSACLINHEECTESLELLDQSTYQETCNIWHLEAETSPDWIKKVIEKEHWTTGKLHCPYCRTRLGAFNFVDSTKCSCGRFAVIRLCKSKIDVDVTVKTPCQASSASKFHTHFDKRFRHGMAEHHNRNWIMERDMAVPLVDALCLEVPEYDKYFEPSGRKPCITFSVKKYNPVLREQKANCSRTVLHRKSNSLDLDTTEKLPLKPQINIKGTFTIKERTSDVSLLRSAGHSTYNNCQSFDIPPRSAKLRSRVTETLSHRAVPGVSSLEVNTVLSSAEVPITPARSPPGGRYVMTQVEGPTQNMQPPFPNSASVNQRFNKREINKLKNLRRKQKKKEKWLLGQKQVHTVYYYLLMVLI